MEFSHQYRKQTCRGIDHVEIKVNISPCSEFNLILNNLGSDEFAKQCNDSILKGTLEAIKESEQSYNQQFDMFITDLSQESAPYAYEMCAKELLLDAFSK